MLRGFYYHAVYGVLLLFGVHIRRHDYVIHAVFGANAFKVYHARGKPCAAVCVYVAAVENMYVPCGGIAVHAFVYFPYGHYAYALLNVSKGAVIGGYDIAAVG